MNESMRWHLLSDVWFVIESLGRVDYFGRESKVFLIISSKGAFDTSVGEDSPCCVSFGPVLHLGHWPDGYRHRTGPHGRPTNAATNVSNWHLCRSGWRTVMIKSAHTHTRDTQKQSLGSSHFFLKCKCFFYHLSECGLMGNKIFSDFWDSKKNWIYHSV